MSKALYISLVLYLFFCNSLLSKIVQNTLNEAKTLQNASYKFNKALDEFSSESYKTSYKLFIELSNDASKNVSDEEKSLALFNAALSLERQKKYSEAKDLYQKVLTLKNADILYKEVYYRLSAVCNELKDWVCELKHLTNWKRQKNDMDLLQDFEFRVRVGFANYRLGNIKEAVDYLESATKVFVSKKKLIFKEAMEKEGNHDRLRLLGISAFESLAESCKKLADQVSLATPKTQEQNVIFNYLSKQLELKAHYYLKAQNAYIEMLALGDNETASKGLHMIGQLYETVFNNLLNSDIPEEISKNNIEADYKQNLQETLKPLILKAIIAYKKNVEISESKKIKNEWTDKSNLAITKLKNGGKQ